MIHLDPISGLLTASILAQIGDTLDPVEPKAALAYFLSLIPQLNIGDPERWATGLRRTAFSIVAATERTMVERVHEVIVDALKGDTSVYELPREIDQILDKMGVTKQRPGYAEMCARSAIMGAFNQGAEDEILNDPMMAEAFPCWQMLVVLDGREGDDHRPNANHVFPNSMTFEQVRGKRFQNCRCCRNAIHASVWRDMQDQGKTLTTWIPRELAGYP